MALTITDTRITSDLTDARAAFIAPRAHVPADGDGVWVVSTRGERLFDRNQAISAMTIEEEKASPEPNRLLIESLESELR